MLDTLAESRDRVALGVGLAVVLWLVGRGAGALVRRRYLARGRPSFAQVMGKVVALALALLGLLVAVTVIFPTVKPVNVLGSLGFFSIAVGFAFRDILENLLAGMLLLFRAPFRIHDEIEVEGTRGSVVEINLRETVVRTYDGRQVLIPNSTVYKNPITVQTGFASIRTEAVVGIAYESDVVQACEVLRETLVGVEGVRHDPAPAVLVGKLGTSSVELRVLFWTEPQQQVVIHVTARVLTEVKAALESADIEMPADIVVVQGTPSLKAALRDDGAEPTQAGGFRQRDQQGGSAG